MLFRSAVALRISGDVRDPIRAILADDQAEEAVAARQIADGFPLLRGDPAGDELGDQPSLVDDAKCDIFRRDQVADAIDDQLEDLLDVEEAADAADRGVERLERWWEAGAIGCGSGVARHRG